VVIKDRPAVELGGPALFGHSARVVRRKRQWACSATERLTRSFTEEGPAIAASLLVMTDRAGPLVTDQVGR